MYSNIYTDHGVVSLKAWRICHSVDDYPDELRPRKMIDILCKMLKLVMEFYVFKLDDTTRCQRTGTAMGTSVYAMIYYSQHEELAILENEPNELGILFYRRFKDDASIIQLTRDNPASYQRLHTITKGYLNGRQNHHRKQSIFWT
jgi:hypothetical protein